MVFSKSFPRMQDKAPYTRWVDIKLSEEDEGEQERIARRDNLKLLHQSIEDAKDVIKGEGLKPFQSDMVSIALALFEKRASHVVYYKEEKAREMFEKLF
ncbi:MAG: hypothetical protein HGA85_02120 [Nanoarchaeota archaeon]|nr:hypothetical protein [Nanoarchaeota archaeon]